jgi:hypothetical protein
MDASPRRPVSLALCHAWVRVVALLVPGTLRKDWEQEWFAEIWHRWQFLFHAGEWNRREKLRLFLNCAGAFQDAGWYFLSQERVQRRWREGVRSPWTCLGALAILFASLAAATHGLPACRQMASALIRTDSNRVVLLWAQPFGRKPHGMPSDVVDGWRRDSHTLESSGKFNIARPLVRTVSSVAQPQTVVTADEQFFKVLRAHLYLGSLSANKAALDYPEWKTVFHGDPHVIGRGVFIGKRMYKVSAVLAPGFQFVSRERSIYVVEQVMPSDQAMVVARVRQGTNSSALESELAKIAADSNYEFLLNPQLRITTMRQLILAPARVFALTVFISAFLSLCALRVRLRQIRLALAAANRRDSFRRSSFFAAKLLGALAILFAVGLEWARPESSMLLSWTDGGSGPLIVCLFAFGTLAVFFWAIADQRGRCRVCLRLLGFPVRMGCPGCVLLDWAGTEFICSEGHGVLHVPHMATSWEEEADRWVPFDESWRGLFAGKTGG